MRELSRRHLLRGAAMGGAAALGPLTLTTRTHAQTSTTFDGYVHDEGGQVFDVINPVHGVKGDTIRSNQGANTTAGSNTFLQTTSGNAQHSSFAPIVFNGATDVGKVITVQGAGAGGAVLSTTIAAVIDANTITLATAAGADTQNAAFAYGTDDTQKIVGAIATAGDEGTLFFPPGIYMIRGVSNAGAPIVHSGRGGIRGAGGADPPAIDAWRNANTVFLCGDSDARVVLTGDARYEGFICDGNNIADLPLQNGVVSSNTVTDAPRGATFIDVWACHSAGTGWAIYGAQHTSYYDCGSSLNEVDGLYIDGGAAGLDFFHFHQREDLRYGIHGNAVVNATGGTPQPTERIRFYSGLCDGSSLRVETAKVFLRNAIDWRFSGMIMVGVNGPTIDLDQSAGYGLDFSDCRITGRGDNDDVAIQISGTPPNSSRRVFVKTGGCKFALAETLVHVLGDPGSYVYSAIDGWSAHVAAAEPVAAAGLPAGETMFMGRTGVWRTAMLLEGWSGTVTYRIMGEGWVQMKGSVRPSGAAPGPLFTLPLGYRPDGPDRHVAVAANSGPAGVTVAASGSVSAGLLDGTPFPTNTTVYLDDVSLPIGGEVAP